MAISPTSPITGSAQTGLTSPTYTIAADQAPSLNGKQWYVSALGGTQTGVTAHSVSNPFTLAFFRPLVAKLLGNPNPVTGVIPNVPMNRYTLVTRKGVTPLAGQPVKAMVITTFLDVPAGAETNDSANVRAAQSAHEGLLNQMSAGIGDTTVNGAM